MFIEESLANMASEQSFCHLKIQTNSQHFFEVADFSLNYFHDLANFNVMHLDISIIMFTVILPHISIVV